MSTHFKRISLSLTSPSAARDALLTLRGYTADEIRIGHFNENDPAHSQVLAAAHCTTATSSGKVLTFADADPRFSGTIPA